MAARNIIADTAMRMLAPTVIETVTHAMVEFEVRDPIPSGCTPILVASGSFTNLVAEFYDQYMHVLLSVKR